MSNRKMSKKISRKKSRKTRTSLRNKRKPSMRNRKVSRKTLSKKSNRKSRMSVNFFKKVYNYFKKNDSYDRYLEEIFRDPDFKDVIFEVNKLRNNKDMNIEQLKQLNKKLGIFYEKMIRNILNPYLSNKEIQIIQNRSSYLFENLKQLQESAQESMNRTNRKHSGYTGIITDKQLNDVYKEQKNVLSDLFSHYLNFRAIVVHQKYTKRN
jgi:hypothetical protein